MRTRTFCLAAALLVVAPATWAQTPAPPVTAPNAQTYVLRYKFKPGEVDYYRATVDMNGTVVGGPNGQSFPLKQHLVLVYHQTVTGVGPDGAATIVKKFDSLSMTMNGRPMPNGDALAEQMKSRTVTMTLSTTGKPSGVKIEGPDGGAMPSMDFSKLANSQGAAQLPENAVKIGDIWKGSVDMSGAFGPRMTGLQATVASTLAGLDAAAGKTVADINQVTTVTFDSASLSGPAAGMGVTGGVTGSGTLQFDVDAGTVIGQTSNSTLNMTMTPKTGAATSLPGPMQVQFQITTDLKKVTAAAMASTLPSGSPRLYGLRLSPLWALGQRGL